MSHRELREKEKKKKKKRKKKSVHDAANSNAICISPLVREIGTRFPSVSPIRREQNGEGTRRGKPTRALDARVFRVRKRTRGRKTREEIQRDLPQAVKHDELEQSEEASR